MQYNCTNKILIQAGNQLDKSKQSWRISENIPNGIRTCPQPKKKKNNKKFDLYHKYMKMPPFLLGSRKYKMAVMTKDKVVYGNC